jgi:hypothetical protein
MVGDPVAATARIIQGKAMASATGPTIMTTARRMCFIPLLLDMDEPGYGHRGQGASQGHGYGYPYEDNPGGQEQDR